MSKAIFDTHKSFWCQTVGFNSSFNILKFPFLLTIRKGSFSRWHKTVGFKSSCQVSVNNATYFIYWNIYHLHFVTWQGPQAEVHGSPFFRQEQRTVLQKLMQLQFLFSVISNCALLPRRSCWSSERGLCYPTAPNLLCGWSDGLEWSPSCAVSDASGPLCSFFSSLKTTLFNRGWAGSTPE